MRVNSVRATGRAVRISAGPGPALGVRGRRVSRSDAATGHSIGHSAAIAVGSTVALLGLVASPVSARR
jgi:hypothetical protein